MGTNGRTVGMVYPAIGHRATQRDEATSGHPAHRGFARAVEARDIVLSAAFVPDALQGTAVAEAIAALTSPIPHQDVYLTENDSALYVAPYLRYAAPESTIVHLAAADRLLAHVDVPIPGHSPLRAAKRRLDRRLDEAIVRQCFKRYCDGAIAVSDLVAEHVHTIVGPDFPVRVVNPYIQPDVYESVSRVEPELSSTVAVTVSQWRAHKGLSTLVNAWPNVRERHPDAELRIVGPGHPTRYANTDGVVLRGFLDDVAPALAGGALYVHPASFEPFGVSVIEGMRAGLPAIVTNTTGAQSVVSSVDPSLVVDPNPAALEAAVNRYFAMPVGRRRRLSAASRRRSRRFTEAKQTRRFRRQLRSLLEDV